MNSIPRFCLAVLGISIGSAAAFGAAPANDNLASAIDLGNGVSASATGTNVSATLQTSEGEPDANGSHESVWWKWKAPSAGTVTITTYGIGFDSEMKVYSGPATSPAFTGGSAIAAVTMTGTSAGNAGTGYKFSFTAVSGTTYYLQVDGNLNGGTQNADFSGKVHNGTVRFALFRGTYSAPTVTIPALNPQPSSGVATGQTMTFNSGASAAGGQSLVFQWYQMDKDGNSVLLTDGPVNTGDFVGEIVAGSSTATLVINNLPSPGTPGILFGNVILVVANTDGSGSAISNSEGITDFFSNAQIDTQPTGSSTATTSNISAGATATFTIVADGGPLPSFQWQKGGTNLSNGLQASGSTVSVATTFNSTTNFNTSVLTITNTSAGDNGSYACVVANKTNTTNSVTSTAITLTVTDNRSSQSAPVISSASTTTFGAIYTAAANTGFGALSWALGTGSTASSPTINASTGVIGYGGLGTVVITATFAGDSTHKPATSGNFTITVGAAPTTFSLNNTSFTYTGSPQGPSVVASPSNATFTSGGTLSATNVGSYTATAAANGNYTGSNSSLGWSIAKANQTAPAISSAASTTFGGSYAATISNSGTGALSWALGSGGNSAGASINSSSGVATFTSAGSFTIKATFAGDANHNAATSADFTVTVNKAAATFALNNTSFTYTGSVQGPTVVPTPSIATFTSGGTLSATNAGSYIGTATATGNYTGSNSSLGWTIALANQTAPAISSAASATFGASYAATVSNSGSGALSWALGSGGNSAGASINSSSGVATFTSVGSFTIKATFAGDANHNAATSADFTVTVSPAAATFALNNTSFTYTGSAQGPAITPTPSIATFTAGGTTSATNAGSYTATATATGNYTGSNSSLGWSIAKANQSAPVISSPATATVGTTYTAAANTGSGALSWALGTGSTAAGAGINATSGVVSFTGAGTVVITASFAGDANHNAATSANFTITVSAGTTGTKPPPMDFDGDGKNDLVWSNLTTGDRAVWFMNGATIKSFGYIAGIPTDWRIVGTGDIDGDGHNDLIWENVTTGDRTYWLMNGTSILNFGYLGLVDKAWHIAATGDFSGDGKMDLLWENQTTGDRAVWYLNNGALSSFGYLAGIPTEWHIVAAADFDGDGKTDILWENVNTGDRSLWLMDGLNILNFIYVAGVDPHWHIVAAVDMNGDGHPDLIWENTSTGDRTVWYMNGANLVGMDYIAFVDPTWEIAP